MSKTEKKTSKIIPYALSILTLIILWQFISSKIASDIIFPSPFKVLKISLSLLLSGDFWKNFLNTFLRCLCSFFISLALGIVIGIGGGKSQFLKKFIELPIAVVRTTPVIAIILITIYWLDSNKLPVFISILMNLPIVITAIIHGFNNVEQNQLNMAKVYNFSSWQKLIYIQLPACKNSFVSAMISVYGLCWKVVVAGEVLCLPKKGLGTILQRSQIHLETETVMAVTILFVLISWLIELVLKGVITKWKK